MSRKRVQTNVPKNGDSLHIKKKIQLTGSAEPGDSNLQTFSSFLRRSLDAGTRPTFSEKAPHMFMNKGRPTAWPLILANSLGWEEHEGASAWIFGPSAEPCWFDGASFGRHSLEEPICQFRVGHSSSDAEAKVLLSGRSERRLGTVGKVEVYGCPGLFQNFRVNSFYFIW